MHTHRQNLLDGLRLGTAGVPIYVQLRDQLLHAIGDGVLAPGDQMPTMREVAVALKVDLNTVRHAYDELERAGAIRLERGRGSFVADAPPTVDPPHPGGADRHPRQTDPRHGRRPGRRSAGPGRADHRPGPIQGTQSMNSYRGAGNRLAAFLSFVFFALAVLGRGARAAQRRSTSPSPSCWRSSAW